MRIMNKPLMVCYESRIMISPITCTYVLNQKVNVMTGSVDYMDLEERKREKSDLNPRLLAWATAWAVYWDGEVWDRGKLRTCGIETRIWWSTHCLRCPSSTKVEMSRSYGIYKSKFNDKIRLGDQFGIRWELGDVWVRQVERWAWSYCDRERKGLREGLTTEELAGVARQRSANEYAD